MPTLSQNQIQALEFEARTVKAVERSREVRHAIDERIALNHFAQGIVDAVRARQNEGA